MKVRLHTNGMGGVFLLAAVSLGFSLTSMANPTPGSSSQKAKIEKRVPQPQKQKTYSDPFDAAKDTVGDIRGKKNMNPTDKGIAKGSISNNLGGNLKILE